MSASSLSGAGFGGLAAAPRLNGVGEDFAALEREQEAGGVRRDNPYPGCACDIPSTLYWPSFAPNPAGPRAFSRQPEIRDYLRRVTREPGCCATSASAAPARGRLGPRRAGLADRRQRPIADPSTRELPGLDTFTGEASHSARGNHNLDLTGRPSCTRAR